MRGQNTWYGRKLPHTYYTGKREREMGGGSLSTIPQRPAPHASESFPLYLASTHNHTPHHTSTRSRVRPPVPAPLARCWTKPKATYAQRCVPHAREPNAARQPSPTLCPGAPSTRARNCFQASQRTERPSVNPSNPPPFPKPLKLVAKNSIKEFRTAVSLPPSPPMPNLHWSFHGVTHSSTTESGRKSSLSPGGVVLSASFSCFLWRCLFPPSKGPHVVPCNKQRPPFQNGAKYRQETLLLPAQTAACKGLRRGGGPPFQGRCAACERRAQTCSPTASAPGRFIRFGPAPLGRLSTAPASAAFPFVSIATRGRQVGLPDPVSLLDLIQLKPNQRQTLRPASGAAQSHGIQSRSERFNPNDEGDLKPSGWKATAGVALGGHFSCAWQHGSPPQQMPSIPIFPCAT